MEVKKMSKTLNFNNLKKRYLTVTLADEKQSVLMIGTPTKAIFDELLNMKDALEGQNVTDEAIDDLYAICAKIMSRNKTGRVVTKDTVQAMFDFEDIIVFIRAYTEFINEVSSEKN
jgi:hypothetical protein